MLDPSLVEHFANHPRLVPAPEHKSFNVVAVAGAAKPGPGWVFRGMSSGLPLHNRVIIDVAGHCHFGAVAHGFVNGDVDYIAMTSELASMESSEDCQHCVHTRE